MQLPENTKELLDFLRNLQTKNPQDLISTYTQSLSLLKDDIHSLFIFLDHINLIHSHSEHDEIEHLYTLFKVKLRKYRIFWVNYLKFEVKDKNKDFDLSFRKIIEYLRFKSFEGKDEVMNNLIQEKELLRKEICGISIKSMDDISNEIIDNEMINNNNTCNNTINKNISNTSSNNTVVNHDFTIDSNQNISTNDLISSNIFTDHHASPVSSQISEADIIEYPNPQQQNDLENKINAISNDFSFKRKIIKDSFQNYDECDSKINNCKSGITTKNLMSTPSAIKTWSETKKTFNTNKDPLESQNSSKINDSSKIAFELEMSISQDTSKLRFSPNKRMPYRNDVEKMKFVDILTVNDKDTTKNIFSENTAVFSNNISSITFKNKELLFISKIGKGGYSNVYRVSFDGEIYALKQIRIEDQEGLNICIDEINLLRNLSNCDFVIRMIDFEIKNDVVNILFEYGETDLHKMIKSAQLNTFYIKYIWESILKILVFIHSKRIVHRDIKPANFVLVRGKLKIIDFGISKSIKGDTTSILNFEKAGTLNYISPEQCTGRKVSRSADIWAAGCILYYMIYKRNIYNVNSVMDVLRLMGDEVEIEYKEADPDAIETMKACLVYDPKKRAKPEDLLNYKFLKK